MATKRLRFDKNKRVKAIARKRVGSPPAARVLKPEVLREKPKYKKDWANSADE
jgi:hypothetical protein